MLGRVSERARFALYPTDLEGYISMPRIPPPPPAGVSVLLLLTTLDLYCHEEMGAYLPPATTTTLQRLKIGITWIC